MRRAIELSRHGLRDRIGGPFGAVIVREGRVIGEACNCVTSSNDPTAHAEVEAIYSEVARPVGERSIPMRQLMRE